MNPSRKPRVGYVNFFYACNRGDLWIVADPLADRICTLPYAGPCKVVSVADLGPRHMPWQEALGRLNYTTMKLGKFVGFSAGSTMTGNLGQGLAP